MSGLPTRCSCAADGQPTVVVSHGSRLLRSRAGCRSAQDFDAFPLPSHGSFRATDGGTVDGGADDHFLLFVTRDCGAERGHSSSSWSSRPHHHHHHAEFWGAVVASQAYWPCHLGIDNLNVAGSIGRLLDYGSLIKPLPFVENGDLIALAQHMIRTRGRVTVRVTKVMEHAKDVDVQQGRARLVDRQGNAEADTAADLGRRHQSEALLDARRRLLLARSHWYPIMSDLHRFMIAVARVSVNHDGKGGTAPDPLVWDQGSRPKARKLAIRVNVDLASLPGPPGFLSNSWVQVDAGRIIGADIAAWPYSVCILIRFTSFLLLYIGLLVLTTLVILVFPFWSF